MNELADIVIRGFESKSLDYKAAFIWNEDDKRSCCELVKDILALANVGGGHLVIGVSDEPEGFVPRGLSNAQLASFDGSRISRFVQNYADPPVNCIISKVTLNEKVFVVLEIPGFIETPHICQKDFPNVLQTGTIYVRTDNNESAPVRSSSDMRKLVERSVRNKQDALLESFRAILVSSDQDAKKIEPNLQFIVDRDTVAARSMEKTRYPNTIGDTLYHGYRELWSYPSEYVSNRLPLRQLREAASGAKENFTGWPFLPSGEDREGESPYAVADGIEASFRFRDFAGLDRADFWHFSQSGFFYERALMKEEAHALKYNTEPLMDVREFTIYAAQGIRCVTRLYESLFEGSELVTVGLRISGTQGRHLAIPDYGLTNVPYIARVPEIECVQTHAIADWKAGMIDHILFVCDTVFQRFNWTSPDLELCKQVIEKLFARRLYV